MSTPRWLTPLTYGDALTLVRELAELPEHEAAAVLVELVFEARAQAAGDCPRCGYLATMALNWEASQ